MTRIERGEIIFRQWNEAEGLSETLREFKTLKELFQMCLEADDPLLVDRVQIEGRDANGNHRKLTLVFQSITVG